MNIPIKELKMENDRRKQETNSSCVLYTIILI